MPRLNRAYKKGKPHRDSRLFVIVAEGEREDRYFAFFNQLNSRIRVLTIRRELNVSAPKYFVPRLAMAVETGEYEPEETDEIWFVCDTDRWGSQINDLKKDCDRRPNWNISVSNPCFEVWLHYHNGSIATSETSCGVLKNRLPETKLGGFRADVYCRQIEVATDNAEQADTEPNSDFPRLMQTKVYKLAKRISQILGNNWKTTDR